MLKSVIPPVDAPGGAYRERPIEPRRTAFLSIDMQNAEWSPAQMKEAAREGSALAHKRYFLDRVQNVLIPNQRRLQAAGRRAGIEIIYTTIESYTLDGRDRSLDHKISNLFFPKGSWEAKVIAEVGPEPNDIVIPKTASGIFNSTNIEYVLRNLGIEYLVIYGVCTDQCVECAIRDAADRGFLVTQVVDCCAADDERRHLVSLEQMNGHYCPALCSKSNKACRVAALVGAVVLGLQLPFIDPVLSDPLREAGHPHRGCHFVGHLLGVGIAKSKLGPVWIAENVDVIDATNNEVSALDASDGLGVLLFGDIIPNGYLRLHIAPGGMDGVLEGDCFLGVRQANGPSFIVESVAGQNLQSSRIADVAGGRLPMIGDLDLGRDVVRLFLGNVSEAGDFNREISPKLAFTDVSGDLGCSHGRFGGLTSEKQAVEQQCRTNHPKIELQASEADDFFGGVRHAFLRGKVVYVTLAGFLLLPLGILGLFWIFEDANWNRKRLGVGIAGVVLPLAFGLAWLGLFG